MTGTEGQGFAMFVFKDGKITGADPLGVFFDGEYTEDAIGEVQASIQVTIPPEGEVIQGVSVGPSGMTYTVPLNLTKTSMDAFFTVQTPLGAVNVRLERIRTLGATP